MGSGQSENWPKTLPTWAASRAICSALAGRTEMGRIRVESPSIGLAYSVIGVLQHVARDLIMTLMLEKVVDFYVFHD